MRPPAGAGDDPDPSVSEAKGALRAIPFGSCSTGAEIASRRGVELVKLGADHGVAAGGVGGPLRLDFGTPSFRLLSPNFASPRVVPRRIGFWRLPPRAVPIERRQQGELQSISECVAEVVEASAFVRRPRSETVPPHDDIFSRLGLDANEDIFEEGFDVPKIELVFRHRNFQGGLGRPSLSESTVSASYLL